MINEELKQILGEKLVSFYFVSKGRIEKIDKLLIELTGF